MEGEMKSATHAFIFARGGSKGIPRKNIRLLAGKPLIAYAIEMAHQSTLIDRVFVSTDDDEIMKVALSYRAEVPFRRPQELALDTSPEWLAWQHAIRKMEARRDIAKMDIFVSIPPTSPLRSVEDVDRCIRMLKESDADIVITVRKASRHPSFNMIALDENDYARLAMPSDRNIFRRQAASALYDVTTVAYAGRPEFILNAGGIFEGKVRAVVIPEERAVDIDTDLDFAFAEFLLTRGRRAAGAEEGGRN